MAGKTKPIQKELKHVVLYSLNIPPESGAVVRKHKSAPKSSTPEKYSHDLWQGMAEEELLCAIVTPTKSATSCKIKQNVIGSNCSQSPIRRNAESLSTSRENNSSSRLGQHAKKFILSSDKVIFFKQLLKNVTNRYPEWVQKIWSNRQQEEVTKCFQERSERQNANKTLNDARNTNKGTQHVENTLAVISEEEHSLSHVCHNALTTEVFNTMNAENDHSVVTHSKQGFSSSSLERNFLEISEVCDKVIEWKEWSLQLTSDGKLIITGKAEQNTYTKSQDVSSWERVDAHTLRHRRIGTIYKLVGAADHFVCQDLPSYVRTKFQYGFPEKWLEIRDMWMKYRREGNPPNFIWSADTDYNRVKTGLNRTFIGSSATDIAKSDHIPIIPTVNTKSLNNKMQSIKQNVFENQKNIRSSEREAMSVLSNITHKRPLYKAHSVNVLSLKGVKDAAAQRSISPKKESTKQTGKTLKTSKKMKNEPQALKNWYPLLSEKGLKFSGFLESAQSNVKHTTSPIVRADRLTRIASCSSGERYQLIGDLEASACAAPEFIKTKFKSGIPHRWKLLVKEWKKATDLLQHSQRSQKEENYSESDLEEQEAKEITLESLAASGNLKKSKRGRVIVPPLQHWLGERITVYGDDSVYCPSPPNVAAISQSTEQLNLKSPYVKKKTFENPVSKRRN